MTMLVRDPQRRAGRSGRCENTNFNEIQSEIGVNRMGAWGTDTFDNDTACDWSYGLEEVSDLSLVHETIESLLEIGDDYLDADLACEGLAACEVIARLKGNHGIRNSYTESVDAWVKKHPVKPSPDLIKMSLTAIDRVLSPPSELLELWEEDDGVEWRSAVGNLRERIQK